MRASPATPSPVRAPRRCPSCARILEGKDLFSLEQHLRDGLGRFGGVEHAVWDAIGTDRRTAGL